MAKALLYYPGCSVKRNSPWYEKSALAVLEALGYRVKELDKWYCCGATISLAADDVIRHLGAIRSLIQAEKEGEALGTNEMLTVCPMCYNVLARVNNLLKRDREKLETAARYLRDENLEKYSLSTRVIHVVQVLHREREKLGELVKRRLDGVRVAAYYGCTLVRPKDVAVDNPESPRVMEEILRSVGIETVEYPFKTLCCGAYHSVYRKNIAVANSGLILTDAAARGADIMVTVCPLCHYNLELAYRSMARKPGIRVMYLTDLLAYVMGLDDALSPETRSFLDKLREARRELVATPGGGNS